MATSNAVFVDTSGWITILNKDDALHVQASEMLRQFGEINRPLVTTDWFLPRPAMAWPGRLPDSNFQKQFACFCNRPLVASFASIANFSKKPWICTLKRRTKPGDLWTAPVS